MVVRHLSSQVYFSSHFTQYHKQVRLWCWGAAGSVPITAGQFKTQMESITATQMKLDSKLEKFGEQMKRSQEEVAVKAVKRAKTGLEKQFEFKKKGKLTLTRASKKVPGGAGGTGQKVYPCGHRSSKEVYVICGCFLN